MGTRQLLFLLCCVGVVPAQDSGRDTGKGSPAIHFVRWRRTTESGAIYRAAWQALEPHFVGQLSRRRLVDFDGDVERARAYLTRNRGNAALVVAFGAEAARAARRVLGKTPVLEISLGERSGVVLRVDRERFSRLVSKFAPKARRIAVLGETAEDLPGFLTRAVASPAAAAGFDLLWVPEGDRAGPTARIGVGKRAGLPPVVTTSPSVRGLAAALTVRPDPAGVGLQVAAQILRRLRDGKAFRRVEVARLRVTVDLGAARAAGYRVPLAMLARADAVSRAP